MKAKSVVAALTLCVGAAALVVLLPTSPVTASSPSDTEAVVEHAPTEALGEAARQPAAPKHETRPVRARAAQSAGETESADDRSVTIAERSQKKRTQMRKASQARLAKLGVAASLTAEQLTAIQRLWHDEIEAMMTLHDEVASRKRTRSQVRDAFATLREGTDAKAYALLDDDQIESYDAHRSRTARQRQRQRRGQ